MGGSAVELSNDCRHIPLEFTPDIGVGRGYEDGSEGAKCSDDRESEVLMVTSEAIFAEAAKIGHIHRH